ncbi:C4-dicarboxylate ABC transporter [Streptomyces sp. NBC_00178]|uniref:SLAC1 family transporter n=1 Tax=Streptomyces sp. NBC_00178 TaxID=2975672 RepID=UPI002E2D5883|nr:C4-dicarboxylate ABC transporter [Streptomyces sp. NBC_00178]
MTPHTASTRTAPSKGGAHPAVPAVSAPSPHTTAGRPARSGLGPSWFAAVMGTGIVANAAVTLPHRPPGLRAGATAVWVVAALLLVALTTGYGRQRALRLHAADPMQVQFFGAPAVALLTVAAGALQLGPPLIGARAALALGWALWSLGTALGCVTACTVPYLMITRHSFAPDAAFGGWLLPVVPPLVSAATGALLVPHTPAGEPRLALLLGCCAMFGLGLLAVLLVLSMVYSSMVHHAAPTGATVPTVWIGLGALSQAVTGLSLLAGAVPSVLSASYARGAAVLALVGGVGLWGFALLWLALASALTVREFRAGLPFSPAWWSFIFPLGAYVTATGAVGARSGSQLFGWAAAVLYAVLVAAWIAVAGRSLRHATARTGGGSRA